MTTSRARLWVAAVLIALTLAGCMDPPDEAEPSGLQAGDFVQVRFVERYANGTVSRSTVPGDLPANATLDSIDPGRHEERWWMVWTDFDRYPAGRDVLTRVQTLDLDGDGVIGSVAQVRHTVADAGRGQRLMDGKSSLWELPPDVEEPERLPVRALYQALSGAPDDARMTGIEAPPELGFGYPSDNATTTFPRIQDRFRDLPRHLRNLSEEGLAARGNYSEETEEGDRIELEYRDRPVDARVEEINGSLVDVHLAIEPGMQFPFRGLWNLTAVDVTSETFSLRHDPREGAEIRISGDTGYVESVNATEVVVDFNDPRAGSTMVYDVQVVEVRRLQEDRDLWSREVDPVQEGDRIHDVAMIAQNMPTVATDRGLFFTPSAQWGETWFGLSRELRGSRVQAVETAPSETGRVLAAVDGRGVLESADFGRTWSDTGGTPPSLPVDLTVSPADADTVYALLDDGRVARSVDAAASWTVSGSAPSGVSSIEAGRNGSATLWAGTPDGLVRSTDAGASWANASLAHRRIAEVIVVDDRMYSTATKSVLASRDGGATWDVQGSVDLDRAAVLEHQPTWLLGITGDDGLAMSQSGGSTWRPVPT